MLLNRNRDWLFGVLDFCDHLWISKWLLESIHFPIFLILSIDIIFFSFKDIKQNKLIFWVNYLQFIVIIKIIRLFFYEYRFDWFLLLFKYLIFESLIVWLLCLFYKLFLFGHIKKEIIYDRIFMTKQCWYSFVFLMSSKIY